MKPKDIPINTKNDIRCQIYELWKNYNGTFMRTLVHNEKFKYMKDFIDNHMMFGSKEHPFIYKMYDLIKEFGDVKNSSTYAKYKTYCNKIIIKDMSLKDQLLFLIDQYGTHYGSAIINVGIKEKVDNYIQVLKDDRYTMATRVYWIVNDIKDWNDKLVKCNYDKCNKSFLGENVINVFSGYKKYCNAKCRANDPVYKENLAKSINELYGVDNAFKSQEIKKKVSDTMFSRYGVRYAVQNKKIQELQYKTKVKKYGNKTGDINKLKCHFTNEMFEKIKNTNNELYGCDFPLQNEKIRQKTIESQTKNNSRSSQEENTCYDILCEKFGKDDIKRQYDKDERYPFLCDFYIKSRDIFIEYNGFVTHGKHPYRAFDENDQKQVENIMKKKTEFTMAIVKTWVFKDCWKRIVADLNGVNLKEFWTINDLRKWVENVI